MNKSAVISRAKPTGKRRPRDIDAYTPLKPAEVAWALRKYARELLRKYRDKGIAPTPTHSILIRACMRGALDCLALSALIRGPSPIVIPQPDEALPTKDLVRQRDARAQGVEQVAGIKANLKARADAGWQTAAQALLIKK